MSHITKKCYETVANLDPLNFDAFAMGLPKYNEANDINGLTRQYEDMLASADCIHPLAAPEATAALRDLDFVAGSLLRHRASKTVESRDAQAILLRLGEQANTVPRGTVFTYAASNPSDALRRRSFTGSPEEELFIRAVQRGIHALDTVMNDVSEAGQGHSGLGRANTNMQVMVDSIVEVKRSISPAFFTHEMRPYFDSITVGGVSYAGAGGAQMQLVGIDRMLWGADNKNNDYQSYYDDNVRYLMPEQRAQIKDFEAITDNKSLVTLIKEKELPADMTLGTLGLLRTMKKFRYPHRKVANDNFAIRQAGAHGSGNYTPTVLDSLIDWTEEAIKELEAVHE